MSADPKLEHPSIAYAYTGFDADFTFFKIYTRELHDPVTGEAGQMHTEYKNFLPSLEQSADPAGFLKLAARIMLAHCVRSSGIPAEKWIIEFSPVMEKFGVPSHLFFDTAKDRAWLA